MTPDQVQKDLRAVLQLAERAGTHPAIARLRSLKLVAVEEAPKGVDNEVFVRGGSVFNKNIFEVVRRGTFFHYIYAGTVTVDENGKVDG